MDGRPWISKINTDGHLTMINLKQKKNNKNITEIERIGIPRSSKSDMDVVQLWKLKISSNRINSWSIKEHQQSLCS